MKQGEWTLYLALVSVQAQNPNLNLSQSSNWSWKDLKGPIAVEDKMASLHHFIHGSGKENLLTALQAGPHSFYENCSVEHRVKKRLTSRVYII